MKAIYTLRASHLSLNNCVFRKHVETSGDIPPPMSGSTACVIGGKYMYIFAGHHDEGPSSTVSLFWLQKISFYQLYLGGTYMKPLTCKIWFLHVILPSSCNTSLCKLVGRIWCWIKTTTSIWLVWVFSLHVYWIMYGCYTWWSYTWISPDSKRVKNLILDLVSF